MTPHELLDSIHSVLLIDWPTRDLPETLVRSGYEVFAGGPGPQDFSAWELQDGTIITRRTGRAPDRVDLVYAYRPLSELPAIISLARDLNAKAIWTQSGLTETGEKDARGCWLPEQDQRNARALVEAAGVTYFSEPSLIDALAPRQSAQGGRF